jgi:hypothetical protein
MAMTNLVSASSGNSGRRRLSETSRAGGSIVKPDCGFITINAQTGRLCSDGLRVLDAVPSLPRLL